MRQNASLITGQEGKITWVTALLLILLAGGIYWAVKFGPAYVDDYHVKEILQAQALSGYKLRNDQILRKNTIERLKEVGIPFRPEDLIIERDKKAQEITMSVAYEVTITHPLLDTPSIISFNPTVTEDISAPNW